MAYKQEFYTEYRVHWSYGVSRGTATTRDIRDWHIRFQQETMGPVNINKVEERVVIVQKHDWNQWNQEYLDAHRKEFG